MRHIYVIGRTWQQVDEWIRNANARFAKAQLEPVQLNGVTVEHAWPKLAGIARGSSVVDLIGLESTNELYQRLLLKDVVWIAP